MSHKRIFRFAFHTSLSEISRFRIHQLRDGDAFAELSAVLYPRGYEYGGLMLNLPSDEKNAPEVDVSHLTSSDLIVLNTRPPIDDLDMGVRHPVRCSNTNLEKLIFGAVKPQYFKICARSQVILSEAMAEQLPNNFKDRANILFHSSLDGSYVKYRGLGDRFWQKPPDDQKRTAVYLIQIPALWEGGPRLLASYGMAGTETLGWNYLLRTRFQEWLDSYQFLMAEVLLSKLPDKPTDLSFADKWQVTPILPIPFSRSISEERPAGSPANQKRTK
jgi:hypothetical protein